MPFLWFVVNDAFSLEYHLKKPKNASGKNEIVSGGLTKGGTSLKKFIVNEKMRKSRNVKNSDRHTVMPPPHHVAWVMIPF